MTTTLTDAPTPDLTKYRILLVSISGGKDSAAALATVMKLARAAGVADRVVAVHADLGDAEWPGTRELAAEHAAHYGLRFEVVARTGDDGEIKTFLDHVQERGQFPDAARRWCTAGLKRDPISTLMTRLAKEQRAAGHTGPVPVLNVMGMRAEESAARRLKAPYAFNRRSSNGRRHVDDWRPIHHLTTEEVFALAETEGLRMHPAYQAGMSRLSCRFCVLASKGDLVRSARLNPELAEHYAQVEAAVGHDFRQGLPMARIIAMAQEPEQEAAAATTPPCHQPTLW